MALVMTKKGIEMLLDAWLNDNWPVNGKNLTMKLYTNNYTPVETSVPGSFTEASGGNYAAKTLANGSWTIETGNTPRDAIYAQQTWTFSGALDGGATIYGYFIVDADGNLLWAELLGATMTPASSGDILQVTPRLQGSKGTPT